MHGKGRGQKFQILTFLLGLLYLPLVMRAKFGFYYRTITVFVYKPNVILMAVYIDALRAKTPNFTIFDFNVLQCQQLVAERQSWMKAHKVYNPPMISKQFLSSNAFKAKSHSLT